MSFLGPLLRDFCSGVGENGLTLTASFLPEQAILNALPSKHPLGGRSAFTIRAKQSVQCSSMAKRVR